jgi:hypothetical protein
MTTQTFGPLQVHLFRHFYVRRQRFVARQGTVGEYLQPIAIPLA